jgi:hypothetical protein
LLPFRRMPYWMTDSPIPRLAMRTPRQPAHHHRWRVCTCTRENNLHACRAPNRTMVCTSGERPCRKFVGSRAVAMNTVALPSARLKSTAYRRAKYGDAQCVTGLRVSRHGMGSPVKRWGSSSSIRRAMSRSLTFSR